MFKLADLLLSSMAVMATGLVCFAQNPDQRLQVWIDRTKETTTSLVSDANLPDYEKEYVAGVAGSALGSVGCVKEAMDMFDQPVFKKSPVVRQKGLLLLVDGLSDGDFVDEALKVADSIEIEFLKKTAFNFVAIRQSQRGDFEDAEKLLSRIVDNDFRNAAIDQICEEYLELKRFDDAARLAAKLSDPKRLAKIRERIAKERKAPDVKDKDYVAYQLAAAREGPFGGVSDSFLNFLKHYHQAEVALEIGEKPRFDEQSSKALQAADEAGEGALIMLGRLFYRAGRKADVEATYVKLFESYVVNDENNPFNFGKLFFGRTRVSDANIVAECMSDTELKSTLTALLKLRSATDVATPIFGAVVARQNPRWTQELYDVTTDLRVKHRMACECLLQSSK